MLMKFKTFLKYMICILFMFVLIDLRFRIFASDFEDYMIIEKYQKSDGISIKDDTSIVLPKDQNYIKNAPNILNYVPVDAKLDGILIGNKNLDIYITSTVIEHEVVFIYKDDKNNNGIPDDEENYIIIEKYQKPDGSSIQNDTVTYVKLTEDYSKVIPYMRNYVAVDIKLDGNLIGKKDIVITDVGEGHEVVFIYKDDKNNNGIPDDEENYTITEKYQKPDETTIQDDTDSYAISGEDYKKTAPSIKNYMAVNVKVDGTLINKRDIEIKNVIDNHQVVFIYKDDKNNNGIPDDEENYTITEKYQKLEGSFIQDSSIINLKTGENYSKSAPNIVNYVASNIKLNGNLTGKKDINLTNVSENHEVIFIYRDDKNNNGIADDDESYTITEKYQKENGVSLHIDTTTSVKGNGNYSKAPRAIENYVAVDVKINDKLIGNTQAVIENILDAYEVTFIYDDDKNNNGIPDSKESYTIIEKYQREDKTSIKSDEIVFLKGGESYSKIPPKIANYDIVAIKIDGKSIDDQIATIENLAGNHEVIFVYKGVVVSKPVIDPIIPGDKKITGLGTKGNKIEITFQNGIKKTTDVNNSGTFRVDVPNSIRLNPEDKVVAQEYDKNNNKSDSSTSIVSSYPLEPKIIGPIKTSDDRINGEGEPSKEIVVVFKNRESRKSQIESNGNWEVQVPDGVVLTSGDTIIAYVVDRNENKSPEVNAVVINSTKPVPSIDPITPGDKSISGKGEPGNTIYMILPDGTEIKDIVVDNSKNWKVEIKANLTPGNLVKVIETNKDGISSDDVFSKVLDFPKEPKITSNVTPKSTTISGEGASGNQIVITFADGKEVKEKIGINNKWIVSVPALTQLKSGDLIKAYIQDKNGNKSSVYSTRVSRGEDPILEVSSDKIIEVGSNFNPKSLISKARDAEDKNLIDKVVISGTVDSAKIGSYILDLSLTDDQGNEAKSKSVVSVKSKNTVILGDIAIDVQSFTILTKFVPSITDLDILENAKIKTWNVKTGDNLKNKIIIDKSKLKAEEGIFPIYFRVDMLKALKGKDISGNDAAVINVQVFEQDPPVIDTPIKTSHMYISGSSDRAKKVIAIFPNGLKRESQVEDNGKWIITIPNDIKLKAKDQIKVYSQNQKGNKSPEIIAVVVDSNIPIPKVDNITPGDRDIIGHGKSGNKIEVMFQDDVKNEVLVDNKGNWTVKVPDEIILKQGNVIKITEMNKNTNDGNEINIEVGKFVSNLKITRPLKETDKIVKGIGTPGNNIIITFRNGTTSSSSIDNNGMWIVNIPRGIVLNSSDKVIVHEVDAKGNSSNKDTTIVVSEFTHLPGEL